MTPSISEGRRTGFYVGMGMQILGGLLFASGFFPSKVHEFLPACSITLLFIGGKIRGSGARGVAGAGILADPETARHELEGDSRMASGITKDRFEDANLGLAGEPTTVITVRCSSCGELSQESANYCHGCGRKL